MEGIGLVLFIIMIVVSLIDQANKAKQKPGQRPPERMPPGRRPGPGAGLPPGRAPSPVEARPAAGRGPAGPVVRPELQRAPEASAADMVAEDFWRELTGQPPRPRPSPAPAPGPPEASSWDEEAVRQVEAPPPETAPVRESKSWDYRRPDVVHEPPVIVSLEQPLAAPNVRQAAYHKRLAAQDAAVAQKAGLERAAIAKIATDSTSPMLRRLKRGEGLRESVIMAEVFGTPRGLEEHSPDR